MSIERASLSAPDHDIVPDAVHCPRHEPLHVLEKVVRGLAGVAEGETAAGRGRRRRSLARVQVVFHQLLVDPRALEGKLNSNYIQIFKI